ncbi:hypothetical protein [Hymenobacter cellulosivorans]|uniref:Histidine kinase n=1 Tax=Hymenobacter cellulosivorans TaxID=2932249 RepID=A0ABY4F7L4_9BACT|nr:hypothetical protein [Hymenobacter cellulosivorans]UOQ52560.1 hypothetical protein MUN80_22760 [Hymenobacter cellulosivorans]
MDITNLDFQQASIKQVLFKSRLRSVLYGVREADADLFSPLLNPLAQWLHTVVRPKYGTSAEVFEIERVLQRMLSAGQDLVRQYQRGHIEEARTGLEQINHYSDQITDLLNKLAHSPARVAA